MWIIISLVGYTAVAAWLGFAEVLAAVRLIDSRVFILLFGLTIGNHLIRFGRWRWLLSRLGHQLPVRQCMRYYLFGLAFIATPARAGEAIRSLYLKQHHVSYTDSLSILALERIYDVSVMLCLSVLAASYFGAKALLVAAALLVTIVLLGMRLGKIVHVVMRLRHRISARWTEGAFELLGRLDQSVSSLVRASAPAVSVAAGVAGFALQGVGFYIIMTAFGIDASVWTGIGIYAFGVTVGSFSMLPGGVGATEATMGLLLASLVGASPSSAAAVVIISRMTTLWFSVAVGATCCSVRLC